MFNQRVIDPANTAGDQGRTERLFQLHPLQLAGLMEAFWNRRINTAARPRPGAASLSDVALVGNQGVGVGGAQDRGLDLGIPIGNLPPVNTADWEHLIYAYMIENTGIYEIFRRVLDEFVHGERLGAPSLQSQLWLRNTEELFYRDTPPYVIFSVVSHIRPDIRASRRNAYWRMFGLDLTHGLDEGDAYPVVKPTAANTDFVDIFEQLLREVWRGIINRDNTTGPKTTDDATIASRVRQLAQRLGQRRTNGNLSREEFLYVATMSWFHLTIRFDTPIVVDLRAQASSAHERLRKIAEQVNATVPAGIESLFELSKPLSDLLRAIEDGKFNTSGTAPQLYKDDENRELLTTIITYWPMAMGGDVKGSPTSPSP